MVSSGCTSHAGQAGNGADSMGKCCGKEASGTIWFSFSSNRRPAESPFHGGESAPVSDGGQMPTPLDRNSAMAQATLKLASLRLTTDGGAMVAPGVLTLNNGLFWIILRTHDTARDVV
jgi:hypothetical protein